MVILILLKKYISQKFKLFYPFGPAMCQEWVTPRATTGIPMNYDAQGAHLKWVGDYGVIMAEAPIHLSRWTCVQHRFQWPVSCILWAGSIFKDQTLTLKSWLSDRHFQAIKQTA